MSEYWKSTPKFWCKHCKIYVRDTKLEKANHDATPKHQGNLKRFLRDLHRTHENEERDKDKATNEIARLSGLATGSSGGESSSSAFGRGPTPRPPKPQATPSQLKQQASQLAELGISIPDEFRGEMAMPGEWQVTAQRLVAPEGEGEKKPEAIGFGVRKRAAEDEDEETVQAKKSKWGSAYRKHPGADTENDDLDELLSRVTAPKVDPGALETKQEPISDTAETTKVEAADGSVVKAEPDETPGIKTKPSLDEAPLPAESAAATGVDVKQEEGEAVGGVVFKKRKAKPMRNKANCAGIAVSKLNHYSQSTLNLRPHTSTASYAMAGRRDDYDERDYERDYHRGPPRGAPVQLAERPAPLRSRDLEDLWRRPAEERERQVAFLQDDYARAEDQPLVLKGRKVETFRRHSPPRARSPSLERVRTRIVEERRSPTPEMYRRERFVERRRERSPSPLYDSDRERMPSPIHERERTSLRVVERERERRRSPSSSPEPRARMPREPPVIRAPPIHQEIITHHRHIDHGYEPVAVPTPPPRLRAQRSRGDIRETEIDITTGPGDTDVEIHRSRQGGYRDGRPRFVDDDEIYERDRERERLRARTDIRRSVSSARGARGPRDRMRPSEAEAEYYARKTDERAYIGEAYNGATKKWSIVDVPPGTERVRMDGVGGGSQEVTWQKYNGVRRSKFIPERDSMGNYDRERERERDMQIEMGRGMRREREMDGERDTLEVTIDRKRVSRPVAEPRNKFGGLWTEITKDLVVREAIEEMGYDYEETEFFFYVFRYLKYDDVVELVDLSDDIVEARRNRIREIAWEREHPRPREREMLTIESSRSRAEPMYDENEVVFDTPGRSTRVYY
ncbi:hypothetical protein V490_01381 [Pseudogymnoascus sp. VKM F-3557]|nr:hypothetical protein V490_01381 [Pseudogymnoascus sp. VKM F-3557]